MKTAQIFLPCGLLKMKRTLLLILLSAYVALRANCQGMNLLADGRIWYLYNTGKADYFGYMFIEGDTIVGGKPCKILWQHWKDNVITNGKTYAYSCLYQEGKRIYLYDSQNGNFNLRFDFGANIGDTIRWGREPCDILVVTAVDSVRLRDTCLRRVTYLNVSKNKNTYPGEKHDGYVGQWIEGIGGDKGLDSRPYESGSYFLRLKDCRDGEDVICDSRLFSEEAELYNLRMLSYSPVWSYPILSGKDTSLPLSETVTRKEVRLLTDGGMGNNIPHVIVNIRTGSANTMEKSDHEIPMYEKGGKVFLSEYHYDEYMHDIHPGISRPYKKGEGGIAYYHLLLYDFTLDVGDKYPCKGEVYVKETESLTTRDGISRKTLLLTNGLVIVEGIGCINSPLGLIAYQNTEEGQTIVAKGTLASFGYVNKDGGIDSIYENGDMILDNIKPHQREAILPEAIHDLQGRRLNGTPQKGVYIQNGRKYVK
jgi:hypothetical protein